MIPNKLKGTLLLGLATFFSVTFSVVSADCYSCYNYCCRWDCCDETCCQLRHAQPCCDDCGFFVGGDALFWTTYQNELDYAVDSTAEEGPPDGKNHFVDYEWEVGYRVTVGYKWGCDGWDMRAIYTYFHNNDDASASGTEEIGLKASLFHPGLRKSDADDAKADVSLDYDVFDFLFSRPYCVSSTHILRPFFGARALWIDNKFKIIYEGNNFGSGSRAGIVDWKADWEGAGLHAGMEYNMYVCDCLSLYANFAGSLLAGENRSRLKQFDPPDLEGDSILKVDVKEKQCTGLPGYQLGAGFTYETNWCDYCFVFNVGYEMTHWFNTPHIRHYDDANAGSSTSGSNGQILLHGATISANMYF